MGAETMIRRDANPDHWRFWIFYYNPADERTLVPKRVGLGWTVNFARPVIWAPAVVLAAIAIYFAFAHNRR